MLFQLHFQTLRNPRKFKCLSQQWNQVCSDQADRLRHSLRCDIRTTFLHFNGMVAHPVLWLNPIAVFRDDRDGFWLFKESDKGTRCLAAIARPQ